MVSTSRSFLYSKQSLCLLSALATENDRFDIRKMIIAGTPTQVQYSALFTDWRTKDSIVKFLGI